MKEIPVPGNGSVIAAVYKTVLQRKREQPEKSYVVSLLKKGTDTICCKVAEESGEVIKAAREETPVRLTKELCDLIFHSMVLMAERNITLAELETEMQRRHGISGLVEKASRKKEGH